MNWLHILSSFFGGAFAINVIPHLVSGVTGRPFQSPFAKPPGKGLSSSTVNMLWAFVNLVIVYLLVVQVGDFSVRSMSSIVPFALGALAIGLQSSKHFGQFHGGNLQKRS